MRKLLFTFILASCLISGYAVNLLNEDAEPDTSDIPTQNAASPDKPRLIVVKPAPKSSTHNHVANSTSSKTSHHKSSKHSKTAAKNKKHATTSKTTKHSSGKLKSKTTKTAKQVTKKSNKS